MMNAKIAIAGVLGLGVLAAAPASAVELVTNGGFEAGSFSGWTQFGGLAQTNVNVNDAVTGVFGARFSPNSPGGISQDIATVAGNSYRISWDLTKFANPNRVPNNAFSASFGGVPFINYTNSSAFGPTTFIVVSASSSTLSSLVFTFRDNLDGPTNRWSLDNVSVTSLGRDGGPVPEPATWAMLLTGFALVGVAARSRRRVASIAA